MARKYRSVLQRYLRGRKHCKGGFKKETSGGSFFLKLFDSVFQHLQNFVIIALHSICYAFDSEGLIDALWHESDISALFFILFFLLDILYDCSDLEQMKDFCKRGFHKGQVLLFCVFPAISFPLACDGQIHRS